MPPIRRAKRPPFPPWQLSLRVTVACPSPPFPSPARCAVEEQCEHHTDDGEVYWTMERRITFIHETDADHGGVPLDQHAEDVRVWHQHVACGIRV